MDVNHANIVISEYVGLQSPLKFNKDWNLMIGAIRQIRESFEQDNPDFVSYFETYSQIMNAYVPLNKKLTFTSIYNFVTWYNNSEYLYNKVHGIKREVPPRMTVDEAMENDVDVNDEQPTAGSGAGDLRAVGSFGNGGDNADPIDFTNLKPV